MLHVSERYAASSGRATRISAQNHTFFTVLLSVVVCFVEYEKCTIFLSFSAFVTMTEKCTVMYVS